MSKVFLLTAIFFAIRSLIAYLFTKIEKTDVFTKSLMEFTSYLDFVSSIIIFIIYLFVK